MGKSCPGRLFQRLTLLSMFALVFSFMAPAMPALGNEVDTSGETHQVQPDTSSDGLGSGNPESDQTIEANADAGSTDVPVDTSGQDVDPVSSNEAEEGSDPDDSGDVHDHQGDDSDDAGIADSPEGQIDDQDNGADEGSTVSTEAAEDAGENEVTLVLLAEDSDSEVTVLVLEDDEEGEGMLLLQTQSSTMATTSTGLQPKIESPENVVAILVGSGITYSNIKYTGSAQALGTFTGGDGIIGFPDGILIGTGNITDVVGPNNSYSTGTNLGRPGDPGLTALAGQPTYDAAILSFDFVPTGNVVEFQYVFSSEEYNEFVGGYNDVFAFYVNGQSCATVGGQPVSVNSINNDSNSHLFVDNTGGHLNTQMDGLTVVLTCTAQVNPGQTNTMMFKIADARDGIYDSNVFLQAKSFMIVTPDPTDPPASGKDPAEKQVKHGKKAKSGDKATYEAAQVTGLPETGTGTASQGYMALTLVVLTLSFGALAAGSLRAFNRR